MGGGGGHREPARGLGMAQQFEAIRPQVRGKLCERFSVESVLAEREHFSRYIVWDREKGARRLIEIQQVRPDELASWSGRASLARRLRHPALLACLEASWVEPQHGLLVLEEPPADIPPLRPSREEILRAGVSASSALALLHAVGLYFGAPMADPLFWQREGQQSRIRVELLARAVGGFRREPICANALRFVPPEIVSGAPPTPAGDLFVLGSLLLRLSKGDPPPLGGLATLEPVEPGLGEAIVRLLQREPANRPESAADVCRNLLGLLMGRGVQADPPPCFGRVVAEGDNSSGAALGREYVVPALSRAMIERLAEAGEVPARFERRLTDEIWSGATKRAKRDEPHQPNENKQGKQEEAERLRALVRAGEIEQALDLCASLADPSARPLRAKLLWHAGRSEEALAEVEGLADEEAVGLRTAIARERSELSRATATLSTAPGGGASLLVERGQLEVVSGRPVEGIRLFQEASARASDPTLEARARGLAGRTLARLGRLREAAEEIQQAVDLLEGTEDEMGLRPLRLFRAEVDFCAGRWDRARRALGTELEIAGRCGDRWAAQQALLLLAEVELALGEEVSAPLRLAEALALASARQDDEARAHALVLQLEAQAAQGDWQGVLARAPAALRFPALLALSWDRVRALLAVARAALETGQAKRLGRSLGEAKRLLADLRDPVLQAVLGATEALALARAGEIDAAAEAFEMSVEPLESRSLAYAQARLYVDFVSEPAFGRFPDTVRLRREAAERIARELSAGALLRRLDANRDAVAVPERVTVPGLVAASAPMMSALAQAIRAARFNVAVHLSGESGTGKELVARAIHERSERAAGGKFVALNCAALPDSLLEAELFGHARGAFTGADRPRSGLLAEAHRGTLFLDEVADLSPRGQTLLLRVLQEKEYRRLGESEPRRSDFRVVSASHKRLEEEVAAGRFREDLFFRLKVVGIELPPLRERAEDVLLLAQNALSRQAGELGLSAPALGPAVERALLAYSWPGNVRELENEMVQALLRRGSEETLAVEHLSPLLAGAKRARLRSACSELERRLLQEALGRHGGNRTRTARELGLTRQALYLKLRRYGLGPALSQAVIAQASKVALPIRASCSSVGNASTRYLSG